MTDMENRKMGGQDYRLNSIVELCQVSKLQA